MWLCMGINSHLFPSECWSVEGECVDVGDPSNKEPQSGGEGIVC